MNRIFTLMLLVLALVFGTAEQASAQNPKQSKKYKKTNKKKAHKIEPYTNVTRDGDSDGDGVPNARDKCIHTPKGQPVTTFGCPYDVDFDGVYDFEDSCVNQAGPRENKGCPWGDKDNDGIMDNVDDCPDVPGITRFRGCPDSDGDGIMDKDDACPKQYGVIAYKGCPPPFQDRDKDGVDDFTDLCPDVPGVKSNRGCPELKPEEKAALQKAFDNLLFETGSDVIVSSSYPPLDDLAKIMRNNPKYRLHLEGHTDNVGDDNANMDLSQRRAASVKRYLVSKGVNAANVTSEGFGETRPKDTNDTPEGRTRNRRVEFLLITQ